MGDASLSRLGRRLQRGPFLSPNSGLPEACGDGCGFSGRGAAALPDPGGVKRGPLELRTAR